MAPRYRVTLTKEERQELETITRRGKDRARRVILARALLLCDCGPDGPEWKISPISQALGITNRTIEHLKKRFVEEGLEAALERKKREKPPREILFDGDFEARLLSLACSEAPQGYRRWTVRLLADKIVELNIAPAVSHMTVQRALKKMKLNLTSESTGKFLHREAQRL